MGFLTTFTVHNDSIHRIEEDKEEFSNLVLYGANGLGGDCRTGNRTGYLKVHESRHADSHTCYVHMGNTVCEMDLYSEETKRLMRDNPDFFKKMLKHMKNTVRELEKAAKGV